MQIGYLANRSKLRVEKEGDDHDDDYKDWKIRVQNIVAAQI